MTVAFAHIHVRLALLWSHNCSVRTHSLFLSYGVHIQTLLKSGYTVYRTHTNNHCSIWNAVECSIGRYTVPLSWHTLQLQIPNSNFFWLTHTAHKGWGRKSCRKKGKKSERRESWRLRKGHILKPFTKITGRKIKITKQQIKKIKGGLFVYVFLISFSLLLWLKFISFLTSHSFSYHCSLKVLPHNTYSMKSTYFRCGGHLATFY